MGLDGVKVADRPRLLSDNGSSYTAGDLADWLEEKGMDHDRRAPMHPQTQGKIERWYQTLKNRTLLENYYLPDDLEQKIAYYNHLRYHESISNLTSSDVNFGRGQTILLQRERIKRDTSETRRLQHRGKGAYPQNHIRQILSSITRLKVSNHLTTVSRERRRMCLPQIEPDPPTGRYGAMFCDMVDILRLTWRRLADFL